MNARHWVRLLGIWACVLVLGSGMGPGVASARAQDTNLLFGSSSDTFIPPESPPSGGTYYVPGYPGSYFGHGFDFGRGYLNVPFSYIGSRSYPGGGMSSSTSPTYSTGFGIPPIPAEGYPPYVGGFFP